MQRKLHLVQKRLSFSTTMSISSTIRYHLSLGKPEIALVHFLKWKEKGILPDKFTLPSLVKLSLVLEGRILHGNLVHALAIKSSYISDIFINTALIEMYFKHGDAGSSLRIFGDITKKDVALFTMMVSGFLQNYFNSEAIEFFFRMLNEGIRPNNLTLTAMFSLCSQIKNAKFGENLHGFSLRLGLFTKDDVILQTSVMDMYAKCENMCYARRIFDGMGKRNMVSWNSIIRASFFNGLFQNALELFKDMNFENLQRPRSSVLSLVLNICGITTDLQKGKEIHSYILKNYNEKISQSEKLLEYNSLVDMYMKVGDIDSAILIFERMEARNVVTWTIMISGFGAFGLSKKALELFAEMKRLGNKPDAVTFIAILSACSHGGLVNEGKEIFHSMSHEYNIGPGMKHYVCMVDLYGRAGLLKEAYEFIKAMPVAPSKYIWGTLLSCCRNQKNVELGELSAKSALELDKYDIGSYVMLSRLYANAARWDNVAKVRLQMKELGLKANTAFSWVEMKRKVYRFRVDDDQFKEISKKMHNVLKNAGFESDTSIMGHNLDGEEEKAIDLCGHTEKVALAFVLLRGGEEKLIRIGKNLRVCKDCHETFKFASNVYNKDIVLKDPNRYHRFSQGLCSCRDFWPPATMRLPRIFKQLEKDVETVINVLQPGPLGIIEHKFSAVEVEDAKAIVERAIANWRLNSTSNSNVKVRCMEGSKSNSSN